MMQNPVYSREMKVSSRSIRLPLIIVLFNGILSMVTLLNMYSAVAQVESTAVIQYSSFMDMYEFVTTIEFILLMFIVPAVTAASISVPPLVNGGLAQSCLSNAVRFLSCRVALLPFSDCPLCCWSALFYYFAYNFHILFFSPCKI